MNKFMKLAGGFTKTKARSDDDFSDRLSHRYTIIILVIFAVLVSTSQYVGKPITCWAPKHFTSSHRKFTNSYCWVRNTYFLPFQDEIPKDHEEAKRDTLIYYQWIPFILLTQAVFFYMPCLVWRTLNSKAGVDVDNILDATSSLQATEDTDKRKKYLKSITIQLDRFLCSRREYKTGWAARLKLILSRTICLCFQRRMGNFLIILYLCSKILYIFNIMAQIFLLNLVLGVPYNWYGIDMLMAMTKDHDWDTDPLHFPRITMCDFKIRRLGNVQRYTVQCVLPINLYIEKIYLFLWFWMVMVALVTFWSFVTWLVRALCAPDRRNFVQNHLHSKEKLDTTEQFLLSREFVNNYLRQDGVFVLRMIACNATRLTTAEIIGALWDIWYNRTKKDLDDAVDPWKDALARKRMMEEGDG